MRGIQEGYFPTWFNAISSREMYYGRDFVSFSCFAGFFYSARNFFSASEGLYLKYDNFKELVDSDRWPLRLQHFVEHMYVPTMEEAEHASKHIPDSDEDTFG